MISAFVKNWVRCIGDSWREIGLPELGQGNWKLEIGVRNEQTKIRNWKLAHNQNLFFPISNFQFRS